MSEALAIPFTLKERPLNRPARITNVLAIAFCWTAAMAAILALLLIFGFILYKGLDALFDFQHFHFDWAFFTALPKAPDEVGGGVSNCITGTLVLIVLASCIGIPIGMLCGIYLSEYARAGRFSTFIRLVVDVLAGVPSIIVGVLGYQLIVVRIGYSAWAGAVALGFMMCPIIARTTEEILRLVPQAYREASVGVGASQFQTLVRVVLPAAKGGIITGIMLAVARVAGETAPLLFTVLGSDQSVISWNWHFPFMHVDTNHAFPSLTVQIFKYASSPVNEWIRQAWAGMLVLVVLVLVLNVAVRYTTSRRWLPRR